MTTFLSIAPPGRAKDASGKSRKTGTGRPRTLPSGGAGAPEVLPEPEAHPHLVPAARSHGEVRLTIPVEVADPAAAGRASGQERPGGAERPRAVAEEEEDLSRVAPGEGEVADPIPIDVSGYGGCEVRLRKRERIAGTELPPSFVPPLSGLRIGSRRVTVFSSDRTAT
jgi:hypothetical protein